MQRMRKVQFFLGAASTVCLMTLGGCPTNTPGTTTGATDAAGTWSATINCTTTESVNGVAGPSTDSTKTETVTFDATGFPTGLKIDGFLGDPDQTVAVSKKGDSATVNYTASGRSATITATVSSATYTAGTADIQLDLTYHA